MGVRLLVEHADRDALESGLYNAGLTSPHAFVRGLDRAYDLQVRIDSMVDLIAEADDLRIVHGDADDERWVFLRRLPWDSDFFRRGIARLDCVVSPQGPRGFRHDSRADADAIDAALAFARSRFVDYVFASVEAADLSTLRALSACGFELIETRCYYHRPLDAPPAERHAVRIATPADVTSLARAAREMINPFDRFHSDIAIAPADADRMMEAWVEASITGGFADVTVVPDVPVPQAFCTARLHRDHWQGWGVHLAQPVLSAVAPVHKGWYVRIISELGEQLRQSGATHAFLVTQLTNNAVIRCWEKLGYQFGKGEHVMRKLL